MRRLVRPALPLTAAVLLLGGAAPHAAGSPTWLSPTTLDTAADVYSLTMDADGGGNVTAAWVRSAADTSLVMSSLPPGAPWTAPAAVAGATGAPNDAVVASNTAGDAAAVWSQNIGGVYRIQAMSKARGGAWTTPVLISPSGVNSRTPTVAVGPSGDVIAAWVRPLSSSADVVQMTLTSAGGGWLAGPTNVSDGSQPVFDPQVAVDAAGNADMVWRRSNGTNTFMEARRRMSAIGVGWTPIVTLSPASEMAVDPQLVVSAAGAATVIWTSEAVTTGRILSVTRPAGQEWTSGPSPDELTPSIPRAGVPQLAVDAAGNVTAIWRATADDRLQASRRSAGGSWEAPTFISPPGSPVKYPDLDVDAAGNAVAAWSSTEAGENGVRAATRPVGDAWQAAPSISGSPGYTIYDVQVAATGRGDAVATWWDYNPGPPASYRARGATLDGAGPVLGNPTAPPTVVAGRPAQLSVTATDLWSAVASTSWTFGDGGTGSGASASHTYLKAGRYTATATATDAVGNASSASRQITVVPLAASGKTVTIGATLSKRKKAKRCPKASRVTVKLSAKGPLTIKKRALKITTTPAGCLLSGTLQLKKSIKPGRTVTAKISGAATKPATVSATAS